jgi:hypothetical protein
MDRKLFFSYIQNMQQNNQDITGFQNSMRKNSWQKPKSLYEMNGGGHVNQPAFDARDREREMYRKAGSEALSRIDFQDLAAQAHKDYLETGGKGDIKDVIATVDPSLYIPFRELPSHAHDDAHEAFKEALYGEHESHMRALHAADEKDDQDTMDMYTDALQKQGKFLPKMP